jgi:hypothetical protein
MTYKLKIPPVLYLLPVLYIIIILIFAGRDLIGDEAGYAYYADNITHGFYTESSDVNIWWEPGYPLILALFKCLHFPTVLIKLINAIFFFCGMILFYKIISSFLNERKSLFFTFLLGLWPPYIRQIAYQNSEALSCFLMCVIFYYSVQIYGNKNYKHIFILAAAMAYLALTKAIFGYTITACIILLSMFLIFTKSKEKVKTSIITLLIAFMFCLPYLFYTYSLTGKVFFWSNRGGVNIYHSTSPFAGEYGDWFGYNIYLDNPQALQNHKDVLEQTKNMKALEKDDKFRELGTEHLKSNPGKFFYNWLVGLGRLMFNFPFSYSLQKPDVYFFVLPNMFLYSFLFISTGVLVKHRKKFPYSFSFMALFSFVYIGGISLAAAVARYTALIYPLLFALILYVFTQIIKIQVNKE